MIRENRRSMGAGPNVDAHPVMEGEDTSQIWWFHLVAHK
jgi:hypothetical protein